MPYKTLLYNVENRIATITLNRPDNMNAFNFQMTKDLLAVMDEVDEDDEVRAVVLTGSGRAFCAGADLERGGDTFRPDVGLFSEQDSPQNMNVPNDTGGQVTLRFYQSKKPLIAAINGAAAGVGATMTLPMDIRLASTKSKFGFVFAKRGIVLDAAASWFLPKAVGLPQALEWTMTGRVFDAAEALKGGLVRSLHEPEDLLTAAYALATEMADNCSPVSLAYCRQLLWRNAGESHPMPAHRQESVGLYYAGQSADAQEGVMSFLEKRPAAFPSSVKDDMFPCYPWWEEPKFQE